MRHLESSSVAHYGCGLLCGSERLDVLSLYHLVASFSEKNVQSVSKEFL